MSATIRATCSRRPDASSRWASCTTRPLLIPARRLARLDFTVRLGGRLPHPHAPGSRTIGDAHPGARRRRVRIADLRGYSAAPRTVVRPRCGVGLDRQKHLPDQPAAGVVVLPRGVAALARNRARRSAALPLRHLYAGASMLAPPPPWSPLHPARRRATRWIRGCVSPTSPSSCAGQSRSRGARRSRTTSSGATSARTSAPGTGARPLPPIRRTSRAISLRRWRNWQPSPRMSSAAIFRGTPVSRARYSGFLRNVAIAMGNSRREEFRRPLEKLAASDDPLVAEHARWALGQLP